MNRLSPNWRHYTHVKQYILKVNCTRLCVIFEPLWFHSFKTNVNNTEFWFLFQLYRTSKQVPHVSLDSVCCLLIPYVQPIVHERLLDRSFLFLPIKTADRNFYKWHSVRDMGATYIFFISNSSLTVLNRVFLHKPQFINNYN